MRGAAIVSTASPGSTQKKARRDSSEASGAGPSVGTASSREPPGPAPQDLEMGRGDQGMSNSDITPRADRDKRAPEDNGSGAGSPTKMQKISSVTI